MDDQANQRKPFQDTNKEQVLNVIFIAGNPIKVNENEHDWPEWE